MLLRQDLNLQVIREIFEPLFIYSTFIVVTEIIKYNALFHILLNHPVVYLIILPLE